MKKICCYSLSLKDNTRQDLLTQLVTSVASLRRHNQSVEIILFSYGHLPQHLITALQAYQVQIWPLQDYSARLAQNCSKGWHYLNQYPLLHKFLNFTEISSLHPDQVLILDCDTYFNDDVDRLFDRYPKSDLVAREEVGSSRSRHGLDTSMIDEVQLLKIGQAVGVEPAPPFNLGVVLLNNGLWKKLAGLSPIHVHYAWRFMLWMAVHPVGSDSKFSEGQGVQLLRQHWSSLSPYDHFMALAYPSENRWILDEVSLWMTLGHLTGIRYEDFKQDDVIMNGEFADEQSDPTWVLCHYFSHNLELFSDWIRKREKT